MIVVDENFHQCCRCLMIKSKIEFNKSKKGTCNILSCCKSCLSVYNRNKPNFIPITDGNKICSQCKQNLHVSNFHLNKKSKDGLRAQCRVCRHKYKMHTLHTMPLVRLVENVRCRTRGALRGRYKSDKTLNLLGCDGEFLKQYLTNLFTEGMTWENYGEWHIDHIIPCSSFDLTIPEEQRKCFHYTNLQPLWAKDNLSKGDKILCQI